MAYSESLKIFFIDITNIIVNLVSILPKHVDKLLSICYT